MASFGYPPVDSLGQQVASSQLGRLDSVREKSQPGGKEGQPLAKDRVTVSEAGRLAQKFAASASAQEVRPAVVAMHKEAIERGTLEMDEDVVAWGILMGELF